ncbi:MAG: class I SAM-dependent methyltransferase [Candidatus Omnitrophota bacterium]
MVRNKSFGDDYRLTLIDKLGVGLSYLRIMKELRGIPRPFRCLDIGCGYHASLLTKLMPYLSQGVGVDVSVRPDLRTLKPLSFIERPAEEALAELKGRFFDAIFLISVLEHLEDPERVLRACHELLGEGGLLVINVPTWAGKSFLEFSAFRLGLSPAVEMDDHKMYYDKKDLWPILVKAGFKPSRIRLKYYKLWLNLFAVISK